MRLLWGGGRSVEKGGGRLTEHLPNTHTHIPMTYTLSHPKYCLRPQKEPRPEPVLHKLLPPGWASRDDARKKMSKMSKKTNRYELMLPAELECWNHVEISYYIMIVFSFKARGNISGIKMWIFTLNGIETASGKKKLFPGPVRTSKKN